MYLDKIPSLANVTVLLPVYNAENFIEESIISILQQTYKNFIFLIIDDGSTDKTGEIISKFASYDQRIHFYQRDNRGITDTLNEGVSLCQTELIARMDADDVALPDRLFQQVSFMNSHPEISVCGTGMIYYETGEEVILPKTNTQLKIFTLFSPPVFHPTVIMRREAIVSSGGYQKSTPFAEDFDLWERLISSGFLFSNIQIPLLKYRIHPYKNRTFYHSQMTASAQKIHARQLEKLGLPTDKKSLAIHLICCSPCHETKSMLDKEKKWLEKIYQANHIKKLFPEKILRRELDYRIQQFTLIKFTKNPILWIYRQCQHFLNLKITTISPHTCNYIKYIVFEIKKLFI